jgi:endonuclease YncB( thermonuclease family)
MVAGGRDSRRITRSNVAGIALLCAAVAAPAVDGSSLSAQSPPPSVARFAASSRGSVYYPIACRAWRDLSPANLLFFRSEAEAIARGYRRTRNRACAEPAPLSSLAPAPAPDGDADADTSEAGSTPPTAMPGGALGLLGTPVPAAKPDYAGTCVVARIVDGDTLDCEGGVRIRLLLIDAPEVRQGGASLRATLALEEMLPVGDSAWVELDVEERDRYRRVLAHLRTPDGAWVNLRMVRRGYAVVLVYPPNVRHLGAFRAAQDSARVEGLGLWADGPVVCMPRDFRAGRCR